MILIAYAIHRGKKDDMIITHEYPICEYDTARDPIIHPTDFLDKCLPKQRFTRGYKRYKETSGLMEWKIGHIFHSIFT